MNDKISKQKIVVAWKKSYVLWKVDKIREAGKTVEDCNWYNKQTKLTK